MAFYRVNFGDVESFEPIPAGEYGVEVEKVEVRMNKAGDGMYLNWEMTVIDGDYENRKLWLITSLKDTALFRLKGILEGLQVIDGEEDIELEYDDDIDPSTKEGPLLLEPNLEGMECVAVVQNEMYEGKEQNRVKDLFVERPRKKSKSRTTKSRDTNGRGRSERVTRDSDDDYEDERPSRRSRDDDDYEDERPVRRPQRAQSSPRSSSRRRIR
jgi:hypothetical protein